jgi:hypothetical protein
MQEARGRFRRSAPVLERKRLPGGLRVRPFVPQEVICTMCTTRLVMFAFAVALAASSLDAAPAGAVASRIVAECARKAREAYPNGPVAARTAYSLRCQREARGGKPAPRLPPGRRY